MILRKSSSNRLYMSVRVDLSKRDKLARLVAQTLYVGDKLVFILEKRKSAALASFEHAEKFLTTACRIAYRFCWA